MKFAWKIFCFTYLIVMLTVGIGGFVLVEVTASSVMDSRVEVTLTSNEYAGKMFLALAEKTSSLTLHTKEMQTQIAKITDVGQNDRLAIYTAEEIAAQERGALWEQLASAQQGYSFVELDGRPHLQAVCRVDLSDEPYYIETQSDFSGVFAQRSRLTHIYHYTVLAVALLSGAILLIFSWYLARPLNRLSQAAERIADGEYDKRIPIQKHGMGSEEIRVLSSGFNQMVEAVESNINSLKKEIEKRETFVADFTHELKTPMTSIIGYADMLRSYDLAEQERREAADAVYREGKRLERLAMRLLDLIVLKNGTAVLSPIHTEMLFESLRASLRFLPQKYGVSVNLQAEPAVICAELTLLLSLLYNLADNACKASPKGETVRICGTADGEWYRISVADRGCGIPEQSLERITEPFYMEDKSRSRGQGGAGLGLALSKRIAEMHQTRLVFDSAVGCGTTVSIKLKLELEEKKEVYDNEMD